MCAYVLNWCAIIGVTKVTRYLYRHAYPNWDKSCYTVLTCGFVQMFICLGILDDLGLQARLSSWSIITQALLFVWGK